MIIIALWGCQTTNFQPSHPPEYYTPNEDIKTMSELLTEYQNTLKKISKWQWWYSININENYFLDTNSSK